MRRLPLTALALLAAVLVPSALAKEPTAALINGPGLSDPISIGWNTPGGAAAATIPNYGDRSAEAKVLLLAESSGFFPGVFPRAPDPMLEAKPAGDLGPRYTIVYGLPGPGGGSRIVQDVYPYAQPAPVTYMRPGQVFWDGQHTRGGWFVADVVLKTSLVHVGLPETAPGGGGGWSWPLQMLVSVVGTALVALILLALRRRWRLATRRPRPA